jgi:hypothetical protein
MRRYGELQEPNDNAGTVLKKAMQIKKKKNLEDVKGNSFAVLQVDYLNQIARDASIRIGRDNEENVKLIDKLVREEELKHNQFADENPYMILPVNLDFELDVKENVNTEAVSNSVDCTTPTRSFKEPDTSGLWTEVVRNGRNRNKTKSVNDKINSIDRCCLKY